MGGIYNDYIDYSKFDDLVATEAETPKLKSEKQSRFIAWDGEGANEIEGKPQHFILFGNSDGERITGENLRTVDCLEMILSCKRRNPDAAFVAFAFDYDVNMILRNLEPYHFQKLRENGFVRWREYRLEHLPGKWFRVARNYGRKRVSATIQDTFGFYQQSFLAALYKNVADSPLMQDIETIEKGKAKRNDFTFADLDMIISYWETEIQLLLELTNRLRDYLYDAGFYINQWHGPGALANYVYKREGIKAHKAICPEEVREAAAYAYAGGRFELFSMGRHTGPIWSLDINSAYPAAIAQLPSLSEGEWRWNDNVSKIEEFGVYHIELLRTGPFQLPPGPFFHRDENGIISYPWVVNGWYWSPEVKSFLATQDYNYHGKPGNKGFRIIGGWEYVGWETRPFEFVREFYNKRRALKALGIGSEKAFKLALNSLYGKMAQRVGWERNNKAPQWHQLEWAGWVTSWTRAKLYEVMARIPRGELIAVETDGIYIKKDPASLGISHSEELGGWEIEQLDEVMYLQSGLYSKLYSNGKREEKYRGLDRGTLDYKSVEDYLQICEPRAKWKPITGPTTRFIAYQGALKKQNSKEGGMKGWHRRWVTMDKDIQPGIGKRQHMSFRCKACKAGLTAYEMAHEMVIYSVAHLEWESKRFSIKHDIPWDNQNKTDSGEFEWRTISIEEEGLLAAL
jgi:hypothetical protein